MYKWPEGMSPEATAEWLNESYGEESLMRHLQMRVVEAGIERAVVEMPVHAGVYTPHRFVHAGAMLSLADTAATIAAIGARGGDLEGAQIPVAISISSQVVGNVQDGILVAVATVPHPGRTLMAAATRVTDGNGRLLALVNSTHFVRPQ